ncbi:hypothetical protein B0H11DRAFT_1029851 [Mycena galericulata]|nr:hypothetical protein B0H11DRAFT_1029851 [Mycena galericulata]
MKPKWHGKDTKNGLTTAAQWTSTRPHIHFIWLGNVPSLLSLVPPPSRNMSDLLSMYDYEISACRSTLGCLDLIPTEVNASGQKGLSIGTHDNSAAVHHPAAAAKNDTKLPDKQNTILNVASPSEADAETPNDGGDDTDTESLAPTEPASDREEPEEEEELLKRIPTATSTDDLAAMRVRFTGSTKSLDAPPSRHKYVKKVRRHPPRRTIEQAHTTVSGSSGALASAPAMGFRYPFDPAIGTVHGPLAPVMSSHSTPVARHSIAGAISSVPAVGFNPAGSAVTPGLPLAPMVSYSKLVGGCTTRANITAKIGETNPGHCAPKRAREEDGAGDEQPAPKRQRKYRPWEFRSMMGLGPESSGSNLK